MNLSPSLMAAEIAEAGDAAARCLAENAATFAEVARAARGRELFVTNARGSSDHAALYCKYLVEIALGLPCASIGPSIASLYRAPLRLPRALALSISQSGQSPDIVEGQAAAERAGALTVAFVNDEASPLATQAQMRVGLRAGPERSVAATKTVIASLTAGAALVAALGGDAEFAAAVASLPRSLPPPSPPPAALVETLAAATTAFTLGRGATFAIAAEAALKLKETCAIHAEAFSSAEVMHGPAELVKPGFLVIAFPPRDEAREGFGAALDRLRGLGARVVVVASGARDGEDRLGAAEAPHPLLAPIPVLHRFYTLAEAASRRLGRNPDKPSNLSKVTETR